MTKTISCYVLEMLPETGERLRPDTLTLLHPADSGINCPWYGKLGCGAVGYFKNCANTDSAQEELECLLAALGTRLGVTMARTALILDRRHQKLGCFSFDVGVIGKRYVTAHQLKERWLLKQDPIPDWAVEAADAHARAPKREPFPGHRFSVVEGNHALLGLLTFVYRLLSVDGRWDARAGFTDMVLFDCMVRQKDRNMRGFGLVETADGKAVMAGLYDNATILMPGLPEESNGFCNILCDWRLLAECAAELFPAEAMDFASRLERFLERDSADYLRLQNQLLCEDYSRHMNVCAESWETLLAVIRKVAGSILMRRKTL